MRNSDREVIVDLRRYGFRVRLTRRLSQVVHVRAEGPKGVGVVGGEFRMRNSRLRFQVRFRMRNSEGRGRTGGRRF
jgi:hypothetical protein